MQSMSNSIVLIGFKHVGKSVIGKSLAKKLDVLYFDLDEQVESLYENKFNEKCTCRQIMQKLGEPEFRLLEISALSQIVDFQPSIISLGGGAPLCEENQKMIKPCIVIHVVALKETVFERICKSGHPAFFDPAEDLLESFNRIWNDRKNIYEKIKNFSIENKGTVEDAVTEIIEKTKPIPIILQHAKLSS